LTLPSFVLLGAPRAATTALHHWLGQHPDVCVSRPKETQFFTLHADRGPEFYATFFAHYDGEAAVGESTPGYLTMPYVAPRIAELLPKARLLAVLREPVAQVISSYAKMRALGVERRPIDEALRAQFDRPLPDDAEAEMLWRELMALSESGTESTISPYLLTGRYLDALRRFGECFPAEQITVLLHDDIVADQPAALRRICGAVGVSYERAGRPALPRVNESVGPRASWVGRHTRFIPSTRAQRFAVRCVSPFDAPARPTPDPGLLRELQRYFEDANAGLAELLGRDLNCWQRQEKTAA